MQYREFGKTGMNVSVLGFGGAEIGFEQAAQADVDRLLNSALDTGLNVIDTGECYADSEELIGNAVSHRREEFHLFTKCGHSSGFSEPDWDGKMLAKQIDRSLQRLRTDRLDLIQLHGCSEELLRAGAVIEVLKRAREDGKVRFIGYSGDQTAALFAVESGQFDSLQTSCNIADQQSIELSLPKARAAGMAVIAKRPIANVAWKNGESPSSYGHTYWKRLNKLRYDFLTMPAAVEVALKFTLAQPAVCTAIVGTKNPERWRANAALLNSGPLAERQVQEIRNRWRECEEGDWVGQG